MSHAQGPRLGAGPGDREGEGARVKSASRIVFRLFFTMGRATSTYSCNLIPSRGARDSDPPGGRQMACTFRGQGAVARSFTLLLALLLAVVTAPAAMAQLYDQPVLVVEPGMHTAPIR